MSITIADQSGSCAIKTCVPSCVLTKPLQKAPGLFACCCGPLPVNATVIKVHRGTSMGSLSPTKMSPLPASPLTLTQHVHPIGELHTPKQLLHTEDTSLLTFLAS